MIQIFVALYAF